MSAGPLTLSLAHGSNSQLCQRYGNIIYELNELKHRQYVRISRGQSYAAYTSNGGWFMAGGYDGNSYPNDLDSTLKLVNDESFEMGAQVSCAVFQDVHFSKETLIFS